MSEPVQIVSASDDRYFPGLLVTLFTTRLFSDYEGELAFTVLHERLTEKHDTALRRVLNRTGRPYSLRLEEVDTSQFDDAPEFFFPTKLTYARLAIPEMFTTERVIYIDSDILVQRDLAKLPALFDSKKYLLGGCAHPGDVNLGWGFAEALPVPIDRTAPYLNAGLLVFDPRQWKSEGTAEACLAFLREHGEHTHAYDQSAINFVGRGRIQFLDTKWNTLIRRLEPEEQFHELSVRAVNIHYIQKNKPWFSYQVSSLGSQLFNLVCEKTRCIPPSPEYRRGRLLYRLTSGIKTLLGKSPNPAHVREWLQERAATLDRRMTG